MRRRIIGAMTGLFLLGTAGAAQAQDQSVGPWYIERYDGGCSMNAIASDGTSALYQVDSEDGSLLLLLGNERWGSLASRRTVELAVWFREYRLLTREFSTFSNGGKSWIVIPIPSRYATNMFKMMITISVWYRGEMIFIQHPSHVDENAMNATRACAGAVHDPFAD